jgi:Aspartyl protease
MSVPFNSQSGLILVEAEVEGPNGGHLIVMAVDTGARATLIRRAVLVALGYDPSVFPHVQITTASNVLSVPRLPVSRLSVLGQDRFGFPVVAHDLPLSAKFQGLLGLDFFRAQALTIDFRAGLIDLT